MKTIELTDDIRNEEPVGYLVFCNDQTVHEYKLFGSKDDADYFADGQRLDANVAEWSVYPLYASPHDK